MLLFVLAAVFSIDIPPLAPSSITFPPPLSKLPISMMMMKALLLVVSVHHWISFAAAPTTTSDVLADQRTVLREEGKDMEPFPSLPTLHTHEGMMLTQEKQSDKTRRRRRNHLQAKRPKPGLSDRESKNKPRTGLKECGPFLAVSRKPSFFFLPLPRLR